MPTRLTVNRGLRRGRRDTYQESEYRIEKLSRTFWLSVDCVLMCHCPLESADLLHSMADPGLSKETPTSQSRLMHEQGRPLAFEFFASGTPDKWNAEGETLFWGRHTTSRLQTSQL